MQPQPASAVHISPEISCLSHKTVMYIELSQRKSRYPRTRSSFRLISEGRKQMTARKSKIKERKNINKAPSKNKKHVHRYLTLYLASVLLRLYGYCDLTPTYILESKFIIHES